MATNRALPKIRLNSDQRSAFAASWLGWMMDAFDYFIIVLVYADIGADFHVPLEQMAFLTTITLVMRPVGAYLFGLWADRVGRRIPLIAAFNLPIQQMLATHFGYPLAMTITVVGAAVVVILLTVFGRQAKGIDFNEEDPATPAKVAVRLAVATP